MSVNKSVHDVQNDSIDKKSHAGKNVDGRHSGHQRNHSHSLSSTSSCPPTYQRINSSDSHRHHSHDSASSNDVFHPENSRDSDTFGTRLYKSEDGITNRLIIISSKVRNVSSIKHAVQPGVSLLQYNCDSLCLEDIEAQISQIANGRRLQSLAFILSCSGSSLQLLTREEVLIHKDGNINKALQEFFTLLSKNYLQVSDPGSRIDFFSWYSLQSIENAPQLITELQNLTGVKVGIWRDLSGISVDPRKGEKYSHKDSIGELYFQLEKVRNWSGRHQQTLAGFEKIRTVGKGSYGAAVLYKKKDDESLVILKEINMHDLTASERQMALNEVNVLAMLDHPNIISYYDSFEEDGVLMIEMEYADNGTLAQYLARQERPLEEQLILAMFQQMVAALQYIHSHNILHRDLKTDNIFLTKEGIIKIGDFGISKMMGSANIGALTVLGTPYYISPEMCEGKQYNYKSDIWALGCILYEMACLQKTFDGTNLPAVVNKIMKGQFAPLKGNYSEEFKELVLAMLKKNPDERPEAQAIMYNILPKLMNKDNTKSDQDETTVSNVSNKNKIRSVLYYLESSTAILSCINDLPPRMKIKHMAVGLNHFIVTTTERQVFSWGCGSHGQLGLGDTKDRHSPTTVECLKGKSIVLCCCGSGFSVFGSDNGLVLTSGDGSAGCLGHGDWSSTLKPKLIESLLTVDVKAIACGPKHVVVIGQNGSVLSWGEGSSGQLGLGTTDSQCSPSAIHLMEHVVFDDVQCGVDGTMLISDVGGVFACGNNENNKLGLNNRQGFLMAMKNIFTKTEVDGTKVPVLVRALTRHKVLSVSMGRYHTAVIVEPGHVITFGKNSEGQLGTLNVKVSNTLVEVKALKGKVVNRVQCGDHYTVASTKDHELFYWGLRYNCSSEDTTSHSSCNESSSCLNNALQRECMKVEQVTSQLSSSNGSQADGKEDNKRRLVSGIASRETNENSLNNSLNEIPPASGSLQQRSLSASSQDYYKDIVKDMSKEDSVIILKPMELIKLKQVNEEKMLLGNIFCHLNNLFIQIETTAPPPRRRTFKKRNVRRKSGYSLGSSAKFNHKVEGGSENNSCSSETSEMDTCNDIPVWLKMELAQSVTDVTDGNEADDTSAQSEEELRTSGIDSSMCSIQINLPSTEGGFCFSPKSSVAQHNKLTYSLCSSESSHDARIIDTCTDSSSSEVYTVQKKGKDSNLPPKLITNSKLAPLSGQPIHKKPSKGKVKSQHAGFRQKTGTSHGFLSDVTVKRREESLIFELERVKQEKKEADARVKMLEYERSINQALLKQEAEKIASEREKSLVNELEKLRLDIETQNSLLQEHQRVVGELQYQLSLVLAEQQSSRFTPRSARNLGDDSSTSSNLPTPRSVRNQGDDSSLSSNLPSPKTPRNAVDTLTSSPRQKSPSKKSSSKICLLQ
uniref:non-specific serine/threonine protein kinase n=1 Tax=Biomphalaria glabrata TaxID=6526 RepID=A0A2C9JNN1_BIOGL